MNALIAKGRYHFHERLFETNTLTLTKAGVASNADTSSRGSKAIAKRVQHLLLRQTIQLALRLKQVARQLQKTLVRPRMRLLRRKLLSLQNWWELG